MFIFIFQKVVFMTPSHKWHHKQSKTMFQITKFTLSDKIFFLLEMKIYYGAEKFYGPSIFGRYDEVKNRAPLYARSL